LEANVTDSASCIAPGYADLYCREACKISAGTIDDGAAFVVQWRNIGFYETEGVTLSFEVRLYQDGSIGFVYDEFDLTGLETFLQAGFAASTGVSKVVPSSQLYVPTITGSGGENYFDRWDVNIDEPSGSLAAGASTTVRVTLAAGTELQGLVAIKASYPTGTGGRVMLLPLAWPAADFCEYNVGEWNCVTQTCLDGVATGTQTRSIDCLNIETSAACATKFCDSNWYATSDDDLPQDEETCEVACTADGVTLTTTTTTTTTTTVVTAGAESQKVVASSMVVAGDEEPSEAVQSACIKGVAKAVGVSSSQVINTGVLSSDSGRRLAGSWRISYKVVFDSSEDGAASTAAAVRTLLQGFVTDSSALLTQIQAELEEAGLDSSSFTVEAEEPGTVTAQTVAWVAGEFGSCIASDSESVEDCEQYSGYQSRTVYCADISTATPTELSDSECAGLTATLVSEQSCTVISSCEQTSASARGVPSTTATLLLLLVFVFASALSAEATAAEI